jgi:hypothetical protein
MSVPNDDGEIFSAATDAATDAATAATDADISKEWNEFDEYTLTLMSNRTHYKKYIKAKVGPNGDTVKHDVNVNDGHSIHYASTFRKERKYYKKRILALTKDLFNKKCEDKDILDPFNEYLKCCIKYLKFKDISDIIQKENNGFVKDSKETTDVSFVNATAELDKRIGSGVNDDANGDDANGDDANGDEELNKANKLCMKQYNGQGSTLDRFITIKRSDEASQPQMILPQIREFNIDMQNNAEKKQKKVRKQE